jgi:hypothetical protein
MNIAKLKEYAYSKDELNLGSIDAPKIDKDLVMRRFNEDYGFQTYFPHNYTRELLDKCDYQYSHNQNVIFNTWGQPRSTKTYTNFSIPMQTKYPIESIDTVFFRLEDLNEQAPKLHPCDTILSDEHDEAFGVGAKRLELEYVRMVETLGKRKINWFITSPIARARKHAYFLIHAMRLIDYRETIEVGKEKEGVLSYCELTDNKDNTIGHLRVINPRVFNNKLMDAYEKKKDEFLDTVQRKKTGDYLSEMAYIVIDMDAFKIFEEKLKDKAKKNKKDFMGMNFNTVLELVNEKYPELRRNIEARTIAQKIIHEGVMRRNWMPRG